MWAFGVVAGHPREDHFEGLAVVFELVRTGDLFLQGVEYPLDERVPVRVPVCGPRQHDVEVVRDAKVVDGNTCPK